MAAAGGIPLESLDKDQLKTVNFLCGFIKLHDFILNLTSMTFKLILLINILFQFSDFLQSYNKLSEICFTDCVNDFTTRDVKKTEVKPQFQYQPF